jgi:hypothetical protein
VTAFVRLARERFWLARTKSARKIASRHSPARPSNAPAEWPAPTA